MAALRCHCCCSPAAAAAAAAAVAVICLCCINDLLLSCLPSPADFNAEPVFPSEWQPGLPIKLPGQARAGSAPMLLLLGAATAAAAAYCAMRCRCRQANQPATWAALTADRHCSPSLLLLLACSLACWLQTRVSPEEYKEFLSLGHGEIFSLDLDSVVDAPWR